MKRPLIIASCALALMAQSVLAEEPVRPDGRTLGMMEAIYARCAEVDHKAAAKYAQLRKQLVASGVSSKVVAEVRESDEYLQAYDSTMESLREVSVQDALAACTHAPAVKHE